MHRFRRRFSRSEWAIRRLGLRVSEGTAEEPGLLLIQIDGLARKELESAMAAGRVPFLKSLLDHSGYGISNLYPGLPSTTPAVQAELFYGVRTGVPAFSFENRATGRIVSMFETDVVKAFESEFALRGENLLCGGSSWSNIYSGGAAGDDTHLCMSALGLADFLRGRPVTLRLGFWLLHAVSLIRLAGLLFLEFLLGVGDAVAGICRGQRPLLEAGAFLSRMCVGIAVREILRVGGRLDLARGLPVIHVNFLGYDELSHRRGPASWFAHWSLGGIDAVISDLYRAAHRSHRRDYQVWVFSDHGQDRVRSFETEVAGGLPRVVAACLGLPEPIRHRRAPDVRPAPRWFWNRPDRHRRDPELDEPAFSVASMGPVGHVYLRQPLPDADKQAAARRMVEAGGIPAVLHLQCDGRPVWNDRAGTLSAPEEIADRFVHAPPGLRQEMADDAIALCRHENAGDFVLLGYSGSGDCWTFAAERGAHGGLGPQETRGFLMTPPATRLPAGHEEAVRPEGLRAAVFDLLGRQPLPGGPPMPVTRGRLRVMSYNAHGCRGMDGRVSPRRIARVIARQDPDIVALQELDHGRERSRIEDQANLIAGLLGYSVVFCPTVTSEGGRYGHAILSRFALETIKVGELPTSPQGIWPEKRAAVWTSCVFHGRRIHIVSTHLGLSTRERQTQMKTLLGPQWLGPVLADEPVILCGDFNCRPGGVTHRIAAEKLRDAAGEGTGATFSSVRPVVRLDHIFASAHFTTEKCRVGRDLLARVSSDHLPLVADLTLDASPADADETGLTE